MESKLGFFLLGVIVGAISTFGFVVAIVLPDDAITIMDEISPGNMKAVTIKHVSEVIMADKTKAWLTIWNQIGDTDSDNDAILKKKYVEGTYLIDRETFVPIVYSPAQ